MYEAGMNIWEGDGNLVSGGCLSSISSTTMGDITSIYIGTSLGWSSVIIWDFR